MAGEGIGNRRQSPLNEFLGGVFSEPVVINGEKVQAATQAPTRAQQMRDVNSAINELTMSRVDQARNMETLRAEAEELEMRARIAALKAAQNPPPPDQTGGLIGMMREVVLPLIASRTAQPDGPLTIDDVRRVVAEANAQPPQKPIDMVRDVLALTREVTTLAPQAVPAAPQSENLTSVAMHFDHEMDIERLHDERAQRDAENELRREAAERDRATAEGWQNRIDTVFTDVVPKVMEMLKQNPGPGGMVGNAQVMVPDRAYAPDALPFQCPNCQTELIAHPSWGEQVVPCGGCGAQFKWSPNG